MTVKGLLGASLVGIRWEFALGKFTELDLQVLCTSLEVCYIHNERVLPKGKWRLNQVLWESKFLFPKIEYLSLIHTFQDTLAFLRESIKNLGIFLGNAN